MTQKKIHLLCNSHIDPVWLWEREEGVAETLSTFRTAAKLCEEFDGFIFNHNEAILYRWVEEHEPDLFATIVRLVRAGKWHIMGGWHLQPDCNMPSGESFIRQILAGKSYFREKFDVAPRTAINFDPFGHTRGLVQILAKSGYDSYLFCRPTLEDARLPAPRFVWVGYDGSEILGTLAEAHYNSPLGEARRKVEKWIAAHPDRRTSILLWGVGNHGGGPSRIDLSDLAGLIAEETGFEIRHSTPERYFAELGRKRSELPRHAADLNPWAVGCYTSMIRVKQAHRRLENELYMAEKMAAVAALQGLSPYPRKELDDALLDLLDCQFHDVLPGSAIEPVEEAALRTMHHGLEIATRVRARAFFALAAGQRPARDGEIPILVYNPHPWPVETTVACELQEAEPNRTGTFLSPTVRRGRTLLPAQAEKEKSNINEDFRKKVIFRARLAPSRMNRFDCRLVPLRKRPAPAVNEERGLIRIGNAGREVTINARTGLVDRYRVHGRDVLARGACRPLVMNDDADPWGMRVTRFRSRAGAFRLLTRVAAARFSGLSGSRLPAVRVIEDGPVRTVVEALFGFGDSFIRQRYVVDREGTGFEIRLRAFWNEKDHMLKLSLPTLLPGAEFLGQVAAGVADLKSDGDEMVAQKWVAVVSRTRDLALTCVNDGTYGADMAPGSAPARGAELRLSLLRSPAYAGHPVGGGKPIVRPDRHTNRIDQGMRRFRFHVDAGPVRERLDRIDGEALARNEKPFALAFFPSGGRSGREGRPVPPAGVVSSNRAVQVQAIKLAGDGEDLIVRLFESTGRRRSTTLSIPGLGIRAPIRLKGFEIVTLRIDRRTARVRETDLLEDPLPDPSA